MERTQVSALLSDYDGTLCPTTAVTGDDSSCGGTIPYELEQALVCISQHIPLSLYLVKTLLSFIKEQDLLVFYPVFWE